MEEKLEKQITLEKDNVRKLQKPYNNFLFFLSPSSKYILPLEV